MLITHPQVLSVMLNVIDVCFASVCASVRSDNRLTTTIVLRVGAPLGDDERIGDTDRSLTDRLIRLSSTATTIARIATSNSRTCASTRQHVLLKCSLSNLQPRHQTISTRLAAIVTYLLTNRSFPASPTCLRRRLSLELLSSLRLHSDPLPAVDHYHGHARDQAHVL